MFLGPALKLCPDLKTISYDFVGYEEVSKILYDSVASYTLDIQVLFFITLINILNRNRDLQKNMVPSTTIVIILDF